LNRYDEKKPIESRKTLSDYSIATGPIVIKSNTKVMRYKVIKNSSLKYTLEGESGSRYLKAIYFSHIYKFYCYTTNQKVLLSELPYINTYNKLVLLLKVQDRWHVLGYEQPLHFECLVNTIIEICSFPLEGTTVIKDLIFETINQ